MVKGLWLRRQLVSANPPLEELHYLDYVLTRRDQTLPGNIASLPPPNPRMCATRAAQASSNQGLEPKNPSPM